MTPQEQQIIESLFQRMTQAAAQAGPRDPEAEALIQQQLQRFPGGPYYMAQTLILQERALQQAEARLAQQGGGQGSFLPGGGQPYPYTPAPGYAPQPGYGPAPGYVPQPGYQQAPGGSGLGGFLAGAGKMALGIGGGILVADAAMGLAGDLFGRHGVGQGDADDFGRRDPDDFDRGGYQDQGQPAFDGYDQQDLPYDQQDAFDTSGDSGDPGDSGQGW